MRSNKVTFWKLVELSSQSRKLSWQRIPEHL